MAHKLTMSDTKNLEGHLRQLFSQPYGIVDLSIYGNSHIRPHDFEVTQFNCGKPLNEQHYTVRFNDKVLGENLSFDKMISTITENIYT